MVNNKVLYVEMGSHSNPKIIYRALCPFFPLLPIPPSFLQNGNNDVTGELRHLAAEILDTIKTGRKNTSRNS